MPDITLQIIINKSTHTLPAENENGRWDLGEIIDGWLSINQASFDGTNWHMNGVISSPRTGFVHITGVPAAVALKAREVLNHTPHNTTTKESIRRRTWRVDPSLIPAGVRNKLLADKEITFTWTKVKPYIRNMIDNNRQLEDTDF